ncbi:MAG: fibrobacter succinogenes major paralogous domain-containing protein [Vulcanibacillus sp.]
MIIRIIALIILQFSVFHVFSQETNLDNKWLLILSGNETENEAIAMRDKYEFETIILNSSDFESLNSGWFINCIPFEFQSDAEAKSLLLKDMGFNNYVKYSGNYTGIFTASVINITSNSAVSGGNIRNDKNFPVIDCGICWSKNQYPTIDNDRSNIENKTGVFVSNIDRLRPSTKYYARAYAITINDTIYGNQIAFTTKENGLPIVTTNQVKNLENHTAECYGDIKSDKGFEILEHGVCWSTTPNPTINEHKTNEGKGNGSYVSKLEGLINKTTYYVRAYATNENGTSYGNQMEIVTGVTDADGNSYNVVKIGYQMWMDENLKTTTFNDNTPIPNVRNDTLWGILTTPAYCWYDNKENKYKNKYGALYNGYTVDTKKLCPLGWHVPTYDEWNTFYRYLVNNGYSFDNNNNKYIAKSLASKKYWKRKRNFIERAVEGAVGRIDYPDYRNKSGFSAVPAGNRRGGRFDLKRKYAFWWLLEDGSSKNLTHWGISHYNRDLETGIRDKTSGFSVRCVKD